jgi:hypothetical protein
MRITDFTELTTPTSNDLLVVVDVVNDITKKLKLSSLPVPTAVTTALATKQDSLVSGTNIKTINSNSLLGSGDVAVQETLVSGTNIKTLNNTSLLGSGNITLTANPSGVSGAIQFSDGSAFASDAANLFWDDTNKRLGIGTNSPAQTLQVLAPNNSTITKLATAQNGLQIVDGTSLFGASTLALYGSNLTPSASNYLLYSLTDAYTRLRGSSALSLVQGSTVQLHMEYGNVGIGVGANTLNSKFGIQGSGSTSATTSLLVQNSTGSSVLTFKDDGTLNLSQGSMYAANGSMYASRAFLTNIDTPFFNTLSFASGTTFPRFGQTTDAGVFLYKGLYNPTSGSGNFDVFYAQPTINQTGGANGITRGLYINPTLTAAADFRAIETTAGKIIFAGLPTSSAGLVSGQLWNDAGTLKIA